MGAAATPVGLSDQQIRQFVQEGYVRIDQEFPAAIAEVGRRILWRDTGCDPDNPATWTKPVIRLGDYPQEPFYQAVNTPTLLKTFDQLVGRGRWLPRYSLGTFPIRFPVQEAPGDTGWHVDAGFPGDVPDDYLAWRINLRSKGRALLMLFLFSDTTELDAPTRLRSGSHLDVARLLAPFGEKGLTVLELSAQLDVCAHRKEVLATGKAGTVYLCHPFLVHAAQEHRGTQPRFMAQPPLYPAEAFRLFRPEGDYSPVETAIRIGIGSQT